MKFSPKDLARITQQDGYRVIDGSIEANEGLQKAIRCKTGKSAWDSEWHFQRAVVEECGIMAFTWPESSLIYAVVNGQYRQGQRPEAGLKAGVPDLNLPVARRGYFGLYMELKILNGVLRPEQVRWSADLTEQGYFVQTITESLQDARDLLNWYLAGEGTQPINGRSQYSAV